MNSNHLIVSIHKWEELNLDELAELSDKARQSRPETFDIECIIKGKRRRINWRR